MQRFEHSSAKSSAQELLKLGQINMKMWYLFEWLIDHEALRHGTQAEVIKLYVNQELVAYSLFENYEACTGKVKLFNGVHYQDLGVIHFVTVPEHRNKGYASLLADEMYKEVIKPLLIRYKHIHAYITATERAVPLMQRTAIETAHLVTQFYSDLTFKSKVVEQIDPDNT
ncbi:GNAT family N-acetyltransferase [Psychromonas sp. RZ22]|uniref:GNAT family N-acetyltransferase n=1 Tax=Psychromonas algarum TaxID=2555643 RepID=UPI0010682372|nr:GNAT family N-acetyltransferase [Psychromonas sp. RZ22]TEW53316.1 GNAT family N-acetyltransferase [Psychromonas sp. RZ22]